MADSAGLMAGKTVLVTGGTGGIGRATAVGLAAVCPRVGIVGRDLVRTRAAAAAIAATSGNPAVDAFGADMSSQAVARRPHGSRVTATVLHPGVVRTGFAAEDPSPEEPLAARQQRKHQRAAAPVPAPARQHAGLQGEPAAGAESTSAAVPSERTSAARLCQLRGVSIRAAVHSRVTAVTRSGRSSASCRQTAPPRRHRPTRRGCRPVPARRRRGR
jgi:NAD(P)-dependent dehydrogenase (short-subunit alcohol dehydrogenase family)